MFSYRLRLGVTATSILIAVGAAGCGGPSSRNKETVIRVEGSDTMVMLAQAWAEQYRKAHPEVRIQISGGGSGVGIASLIEGGADLANATREMNIQEKDLAAERTGSRPVEFTVGMDALAVYVHKDNPLQTISLEELREIYGENGTITEWKQLGVQHTACQSDQIIRISRLNNSGTYRYFREIVLGDKRDYRLGSIELMGSKDVVTMVASTPCSIGYSGLEYATDEVKCLRIAETKGGVGVEPNVQTVQSGDYPISRPLHIYTLGQPTGAIKEYLDWIMSNEGQQIALDMD